MDSSDRIRITPATTPQDLHLVGRFRYAVTVEEMKLRMRHADHAQRVVVEPLDFDGLVFAAWEGDHIVGTVRTNLLSRSRIGAYYSAYAIGQFPAELRATMSITTRLAIHPRHRGAGLFVRLAGAAYRYLLGEGVTHDVIDCRKPLVPLFLHLGYRVHKPDLEHHEFGPVTVLSLGLRDADYLQTVRSPFREALTAWQKERCVAVC